MECIELTILSDIKQEKVYSYNQKQVIYISTHPPPSKIYIKGVVHTVCIGTHQM